MDFIPLISGNLRSNNLCDSLVFGSGGGCPRFNPISYVGHIDAWTTPIQRRYMFHPHQHVCKDVGTKEVSSSDSDPTKFQRLLNVKHYQPEELSVKTVNNFVVIHGKHQETADEYGFVSREFTRKYAIPEDVDPAQIKSSLSRDGILTVEAELKKAVETPSNERLISIELQHPAVEDRQSQEQMDIPVVDQMNSTVNITQ